MLVDGHSLLFQMFFGMPNKIKNKRGKNIEGVIGFVGALLKILQQINPTHMLVVFDGEIENKRKEIDANYKANRVDYSQVPEEDNPFAQFDYILKSLQILYAHHEVMTSCEADDYIAGVCKGYQNHEIVIVSQDKDFFQLINENVSVYQYRGDKSKLWKEQDVLEKYDVMPSQWALFRAMMGDPSDNLKGIKGIGPKTASKLLKEKDEESLLDKFSLEEQEIFLRNLKLMSLKDVPIQMVNLNMLNQFLPHSKTLDVLAQADIK